MKFLCAGITLWRPLLIVSMIHVSEPPCSQISSLRFGAQIVRRAAGKLKDVMRYVFDVLIGTDRRSHGRHGSPPAFRDAGANGFRVAAVQPVIVAKAREPSRTACVGAMALRT